MTDQLYLPNSVDGDRQSEKGGEGVGKDNFEVVNKRIDAYLFLSSLVPMLKLFSSFSCCYPVQVVPTLASASHSCPFLKQMKAKKKLESVKGRFSLIDSRSWDSRRAP